MKEFATNDTRPDADGAPRHLRQWLASKGLTLDQWRQSEYRKHDAESSALALRRRRLALMKAR